MRQGENLGLSGQNTLASNSNHDPRPAPELTDKLDEMRHGKRDTALRRQITGTGGVHEDRTTQPTAARVIVVTKYDNKIVNVILTPEPFGTGRIWVLHSAIVVAIARRVAPTVAAA